MLCISEQGELGDGAQRDGVAVSALNEPIGRNGRLPFRLAATLRSMEAEVIHTHGPYAHLYGTVAARLAGNCRVVHTMHGFPWPRTRRRRMLNRLSSALTSYVVAVSNDLASYARRELNVREEKLRVIHNGINVDAFAEQNGRDWTKREGAIMVARLSPEKDFQSLLMAADLVRKRHPDFRLMLAGEGPQRGEVEGLIRKLDLDQHVKLLGTRSDVPDLLASARVFILSSHTEGLSVALLEAMACGLPVVATAVGGNPEVVVDGDTGFLVAERSPDQLAGRLLWLLEHPDKAKWMGEAGRHRVREMFSVRRMVESYEKLYWRSVGRAVRQGHGLSQRSASWS